MRYDPLVRRGVLSALGAAALFGATAPIAKLLLPDAGPLSLGGLLYLGAGLGLVLVSLVRRSPREAALHRRDVPLLLAMIVAGGIVGPALMLAGMVRLSGMASALLLNL
jgi:drug/metabolite transporter (DMT)-like permease